MADPMEVAAHEGDAAMAAAPTRRVYVEACVFLESAASFADVEAAVSLHLQQSATNFTIGHAVFADSAFLKEHVQRLEVTAWDEQDEDDASGVPSSDAELIVNVFKLSDEPPAEETAEDDENVSTCQQLVLPSQSLDGLWESLIFDDAVKRNVLDYATTAMLFSDARVNPHIISWNRVVLLHGPPGTGKTSLCKALAQKLSIRLSQRYASGHLLEINAHSLFSKWFSESGKLVMKLFRQIHELVDDQDALVCVLIDEVESLTAARKAALSGSEPSDAIRVVNALLTQLDSLKQFANVLVLTTSNLTEAMDVAFIDRADIKQYIGLPSVHARYEILRSCVDELSRVGLVDAGASSLVPYAQLTRRRASGKKRGADEMAVDADSDGDRGSLSPLDVSTKLLRVAETADGFSGRSLRKLPFQAHAFCAQRRRPRVDEFLAHLATAVAMEKTSRSQLTSA